MLSCDRGLNSGVGTIVDQAAHLVTVDLDLLVLVDEFLVPMTSGRSETIVTAAVFKAFRMEQLGAAL